MRTILLIFFLFCTLISSAQPKSFRVWDKENNVLWGYQNEDGDTVIKPVYNFAKEFKEGLAAVGNKEGKYGYINETGKVVIPYMFIQAEDFSEGLAAVMLDVEKGLGYIDKNGEFIIPEKYKSAGRFSEGLAVVLNRSEKYGYIDKTGKVVIPFIYDEAYSFGYDMHEVNRGFNGLACVNKGNILERRMSFATIGKWGLIDKNGIEVLPIKYGYIYWLSDNMAAIFDGEFEEHIDSVGGIHYDTKGVFGFINNEGRIMIEPQYEDTNFFFNNGQVQVTKAGYTYIINKKGEKVADVNTQK